MYFSHIHSPLSPLTSQIHPYLPTPYNFMTSFKKVPTMSNLGCPYIYGYGGHPLELVELPEATSSKSNSFFFRSHQLSIAHQGWGLEFILSLDVVRGLVQAAMSVVSSRVQWCSGLVIYRRRSSPLQSLIITISLPPLPLCSLSLVGHRGRGMLLK